MEIEKNLFFNSSLEIMKNSEIARIFEEIAAMLEAEGVAWKPNAYRRAALTIATLSEDIEEVYKQGRLRELPGVGESIAQKIEEYLKTGKIKYYEELKQKYPIDFSSFSKIEGLGPKTIVKLYKFLGVKNLEDLKKAIEEHKLRDLPGFGEKSEEKIKKNIELYEETPQRLLLGYVLPEAETLKKRLEESGLVKRVEIVGSIRRMKETIGDIDILVIIKEGIDPMKVMDYFVSLPEIKEVEAKGPAKTSVALNIGIDCDLRVFEEESFGAAMLYFTGNKQHNIEIRKIAIKKGYKLNEYGLFKKNKLVAGKSEEEVYDKLGMQYIPPEMRELKGEIELSLKHKLPKIVEYSEVKGDLHMHSKYSDGGNSIKEIAEYAKKLGLEYITISDHSSHLKIAHGLTSSKYKKQFKEIEQVEKEVGIKIFKSGEIDILKDGSLDITKEVAKEMDFVIAAVHSNFSMSKEEMTNRVIKALRSKMVNILAHPTGKLLNQRPPYEIDLTKVFEVAKEENVIMEINSFPDRLDLNADNIMLARSYGIKKFSIGTDSHRLSHLLFLKLGIGTARRGWCTKEEILNTLSTKELEKFFEKNK
ncbi:MAG: DNA polymerase/3'-5' exonuclease PolX [Candidatus Micrarchaeia archaeon]